MPVRADHPGAAVCGRWATSVAAVSGLVPLSVPSFDRTYVPFESAIEGDLFL